MTKLTGHDSSVLALIAMRPSEFDKFKHHLSGDALAIGEYVAGIAVEPTDVVRGAGDHLKEWAKGMIERAKAREAEAAEAERPRFHREGDWKP